jgi:7-carboxy-7-deazaguanine synthase
MKTQSLSDQSLPVMEHFYTIQGEGFHQGKAAYFIRLGGCDVGCVWCDVKESWDITKHPLTDIKKLAAAVSKSPAEIVVITGGEPLMHDLTYLTNALHSVKKQVHIETSGAYPLSGNLDWITLSPKKFKAPLSEILPLAHELKVVIFNKSDFKWAEEYANKISETCKLFLQPEWSKRETMMPLISDYILKNPKWEVSLQIHKYMQLP